MIIVDNMELTYKTHNRTTTSMFTPANYVGVDKKLHDLGEEFLSELKNIKYLGTCGFKGEMFIGSRDDSDYFTTELVIFFGTFEDIEL